MNQYQKSQEFEKKLGDELLKLGINFHYSYNIPGTKFRADLFISAPIRVILEIKQNIGAVMHLKRMSSQLTNLYSAFNHSVSLYLITFDELTQSQKNIFGSLPIEFLTIEKDIDKPEIKLARQIKLLIASEAKALKDLEIMRYQHQLIAIENEKAHEEEILQDTEDELINLLKYNSNLLDKYSSGDSSDKTYKAIEESQIKINKLVSDVEYYKHHLTDLKNAKSSVRKEIDREADEIFDLIKEVLPKIKDANQNKDFLDDSIFNRKPIKDGLFSDVLGSFQTFMSNDSFDILVKEVSDFEEEFESKHYTTAVLRIGRTLEYVIYTLVKSWGVNLNKQSMERIDILNNHFEKLKKHLIYFYTSEENEKERNKKRLIDAFKETGNALVDMQTDLDRIQDINLSKQIVNIDTLLRDVKNRYVKNDLIRNEIQKLIKSELINKLYSKRNEAAHANISGLRKDFSKEEVKELADTLNVVLFNLANIHDAITKSSS